MCCDAYALHAFGVTCHLENSIFLRLTVELAGKYALVGILWLLRHVRWYVVISQSIYIWV